MHDNYDRYPFELKPLPYAYNALQPYIDEKTMRLHHDKHLAAYVDNLNAALADYPAFHHWSLEQLLYYSDRLPEKIRTAVLHNGGGVYNHNLYFAGLATQNPVRQSSKGTKTARIQTEEGSLPVALSAQFGSLEAFKDKFKAKALSVFGSGYTWLVVSGTGELSIVNTQNQETVLPLELCPIMLVDVWEHAYYLKNYNVRADYIDNWFMVASGEAAEENYRKCLQFVAPPLPEPRAAAAHTASAAIKTDYGPAPFVTDIQKATLANDTYRTALWTGENLQLTLMRIEPGDDIGLEVHEDHDQFLRLEEGSGVVQMGKARDALDFQESIYADSAIFVPAGTWHNLTNTGKAPLKLYSIYAPPEHPRGTVQKSKK
ncbi:MAG: cupin domain-containing protein [Firmicutes bacterium]|nr:cupin domain-containing protein [Bacillota bacterium]